MNKNKCLKNIFQKNFKPISWKENLFKKKKFGKIGNWSKMWHFWLFCNVWNCTERDEICTCVNDLNTTFIEESGFRPQQRSMSLSLFKDDFCFLHARENLSSEPDFRWLFWQSSTWKLVKLSGTRWTWIFSKSNTIANRTKKKSFHSG